MENQKEETFANKEWSGINATCMALLQNNELPIRESNKIVKLSSQSLKLQKVALKEFKTSKGVTSSDANEAKCMELVNEAKAILKPYLNQNEPTESSNNN